MKTLFRSFSIAIVGLFALANIAFAQSPQGINWQAVIRDGSGNLMMNQNVSLKFTVHQISATGTIVYQETYTAPANAYGLVNTVIGQGTPVVGTMAGINWLAYPHFLQVLVNNVDMGTTQFMTVPYAFVADTVLHSRVGLDSISHDTTFTGKGTVANPLRLAQHNVTSGQVLGWNGSNWVPADISTSAWSLSGNSGTTNANFIGTSDNHSLQFRVNNQKAGLIDSTNSNTFFGFQSGTNSAGSGNVFLGYKAGVNATTTNGNVFIGANAGYSYQTSQSGNVFIGPSSGYSNSTGFDNIFVGGAAGYTNTSGASNYFAGSQAGYQNTTGGSNIFIRGGSNNTTGNNNICLSTTGSATGSGNTFIGLGNGSATTSGGSNTYLGSSAGVYNNGSNNTFIGAATQNSVLLYNTLSNATALGYNALATASNSVVVGNSSVTSIGGYANWSNLSDGRFKSQVEENVVGLAFINHLRPVTYHLDLKKLNRYLYGDVKATELEQDSVTGVTEKEKVAYSGFVAQEVESAARNASYDFSGITVPQNANDHYRISYADFVVPLVKAVQEQQATIERQNKQLAETQARLKTLEEAVKALQTR